MNQTQNSELIAAKTRKENAQADKIEFQLAILRKEYAPVSDVNKQWIADVGKVRTKLLGLSTRIAPQLAGQIHDIDEVKRLIDSVVYEALTELADQFKKEE